MEHEFAIGVYWLNIFLLGIMLFINWSYASKHNFIADEELDVVSGGIKRRIITAQILYLAGALLCFANPYLGIGFIIVIQLNYAFAFISRGKSD